MRQGLQLGVARRQTVSQGQQPVISLKCQTARQFGEGLAGDIGTLFQPEQAAEAVVDGRDPPFRIHHQRSAGETVHHGRRRQACLSGGRSVRGCAATG